ncbi:MAG: adenylate/guanylate cyclase domain-containing protein, partial [Anaerolineae bacterium]
ALTILREQVASLEAQRSSVAIPVEERRLVTILFADIVGSTALAERMDPEEWHDLIAHLFSTLDQLIEKYGGVVASHLGDGVLALFGVPAISEADAENAIRAALEIQNSDFKIQPALAASLEPAEPRVLFRIGIHTGLVVTGEIALSGHKELAAMGDAMNLAARLQAAAPPGGILISNDTWRYVRRVFEVIPQPELVVKGKKDPVQTFLVNRATLRQFQTVTRGVAGVHTRLVGRDVELAGLQAADLEACREQRMVWRQLIGEAGMGKSRLLEELYPWIKAQPERAIILRGRAFIGDAARPYALVRRFWFDLFEITEDLPLSEAETRWVAQFQLATGRSEVEPAQALGLLVGLRFDNSPYIGAMRNDPKQVKGRALVVSRQLLAALRRPRPVVVFLEDLHWIDAASWEYLQALLLEGPVGNAGQGLFVVATARPEWMPPAVLAAIPAFRTVQLTPLAPDCSLELVSSLLSRVENVPDDLVQFIVTRAEGVPYFAEELVNLLIDRGVIDTRQEVWRYVAGRLDITQVPQTLQQLLLTRLLSLPPPLRACLQFGSIFGRQFPEGGVSAMGLSQTDQLLLSLRARGFIEPVDATLGLPEREWRFQHTFLQQVAYESVLKRERPRLHRLAAQWLEEQARHTGRLDEWAGALGQHCEQAGDLDAAAEWYLMAGEHAQAAFAWAEAKRFWERVLDLSSDRQRRWRALCGREAVLDLRGEREAQKLDIAALLALADAANDNRWRAEARYRQLMRLRALGDWPAVAPVAQETIAAARQTGNRALEARGLAVEVIALARTGEGPAARVVAQEAFRCVQESQDEAAFAFVLVRLAIYYSESGDPVRAAGFYTQGAEMARRVGDRVQEALAVGNLSIVHASMGLYERARISYEQVLGLVEAIGERRLRAYNMLNLGNVIWRIGNVPAARRMEEEALAELIAVNDANGLFACKLELANLLEAAGEFQEAALGYVEVYAEYSRIGDSDAVAEAASGLARCAIALGQWDEARRWATKVADYLVAPEQQERAVSTRACVTVADVFDALQSTVTGVVEDVRHGDRVRQVIEVGYRRLMMQAARISDPEWRQSYLENVPENRAIVERWERLENAESAS